MFETIRPVAPSIELATNAALDRLEQTFACHLPPDYRAFLTTFGPGTLDDGQFTTEILSPPDVIAQTDSLRSLFREPGEQPPWHLLFFDIWDNAPTYMTAEDLDRFLVIGADTGGSSYILLPHNPPHYFELMHEGPIGDAGTTMDSFLAYLDPRVRYEPHARRIVENGRLRETDGRFDGTPYIQHFLPQGHDAAATHSLVEQEITWGHSDDGQVTWNLSAIYTGWHPVPIATHLQRYPLLSLLEAIALGDPTTRFEAEESATPTARLTVPRFSATLRVGPGWKGLTLYITAPEDAASTLYRWLVDQARRWGYAAPHTLLTLAAHEHGVT